MEQSREKVKRENRESGIHLMEFLRGAADPNVTGDR